MCLPSPPCLALLSWVPSFPFSLCSPVILPSLPRVPRCPLSMIRATPRPFCRCGRCHGSVQLFVALPVVCSYFDSSLHVRQPSRASAHLLPIALRLSFFVGWSFCWSDSPMASVLWQANLYPWVSREVRQVHRSARAAHVAGQLRVACIDPSDCEFYHSSAGCVGCGELTVSYCSVCLEHCTRQARATRSKRQGLSDGVRATGSEQWGAYGGRPSDGRV